VRPYEGDFYRPTPAMTPGQTVFSDDPAITSGASTVTRGVFGGTAHAFGAEGGGGE
jgi:hypothetical protein